MGNKSPLIEFLRQQLMYSLPLNKRVQIFQPINSIIYLSPEKNTRRWSRKDEEVSAKEVVVEHSVFSS